MSVQENNQIIEKWFATINGKDYGGYLDLFSDDIVARSTANTEPMEGKEVSRQLRSFQVRIMNPKRSLH